MHRHTVFVISRNGRFSPQQNTGAVEMTVADLVKASSFANLIEVVGPHQLDASGLPVPTYDGVNYMPIEVGERPTKSAWHRLLKREFKTRPAESVIVEQSPRTAAYLQHHFPEMRVILHRHDAQPVSSPFKRLFQDRAMRKADLILANSDFTRQHHITKRGQDPDKVVVLYNGISLPDEKTIASKEKRVLCVAAMLPKKGAHLFSGALRELAKKWSDWQFDFVSETSGKAPKGYREVVFADIKAAGPNVNHHDFLPHQNILDMYARSSIAVVPSQWEEPFGRTAGEAAAAACAIVHSGRGGLSEVVGDAGLVPDAQTVEGYCKAINELMSNAARRQVLGVSARQHAAATYDLRAVGGQFDALIFGNRFND